jgi:hypothetical protein
VLLALALPLTLPACGGDDGGSDEDEITDVIETSVTSDDPETCTTLATQEFVEQTTFEVGEAAIAQCEEDARDTSDDPDSAQVSDVSVDGEDATADVAFVGGPLDGSTVSVALVKDGDDWKLNEITDIPEFDFEAFQAAFTAELSAEGDLPPELADCIVQAFGQAGEERVKEVFLSGDGQQLNAIFAGCIPGQ